MTAIEIIRYISEESGTTLTELAEYADVGSKQNLNRLLSQKDLKVGTFVKLLETLGFQLVAQSTENSNEFVLDYEEV